MLKTNYDQPNAGSDTRIIYIYKLTLTIFVRNYFVTRAEHVCRTFLCIVMYHYHYSDRKIKFLNLF
jgi:hypothetical protein